MAVSQLGFKHCAKLNFSVAIFAVIILKLRNFIMTSMFIKVRIRYGTHFELGVLEGFLS